MPEHDSARRPKDIVILCPALQDPSKGPPVGLLNLTAVLAALSKRVLLVSCSPLEGITLDNVSLIDAKMPRGTRLSEHPVTRVIRYLATQVALSTALIRISLNRNYDIEAVFTFIGEASLLTTVVSRLLGKKTLLTLRGTMMRGTLGKERKGKDLLFAPLSILRKLNLALVNTIIVYSKGVVPLWNLESYRNKVYTALDLFVDFDIFRQDTPFEDRDNVVGYIGRLHPVKGAMNFVQAVPLILEMKPDTRFLIAGQGEMLSAIRQHIDQHELNDRVSLLGWVEHHALPAYLNRMRLLVMPSYSEGLPGALLEAMACGTPVMATRVGSIPDTIADGQNGFLLENNSPECIAKHVIGALDHQRLGEISHAARRQAREEFSWEAAVARYRTLLEETASAR